MLLRSDDGLSLDEKNETPVAKVWLKLLSALEALDSQKKDSLFKFINTRCQLVRIVTDDLDEAFRVFDSQNYRGKPLAPHDLLNAHHLREMQGESAAIKVGKAGITGWGLPFLPMVQRGPSWP